MRERHTHTHNQAAACDVYKLIKADSVYARSVYSIAVTKTDILDTFDEIKIGLSYKLDGKRLDSMPAEQSQLERVEVEYLVMPGWKSSIAHTTVFSDLPPNAQAYILKLEELVGVPGEGREGREEGGGVETRVLSFFPPTVQWVGTGPARDDMICRF